MKEYDYKEKLSIIYKEFNLNIYMNADINRYLLWNSVHIDYEKLI